MVLPSHGQDLAESSARAVDFAQHTYYPPISVDYSPTKFIIYAKKVKSGFKNPTLGKAKMAVNTVHVEYLFRAV